MIAHRGLVNCIEATNREFRVTEDDRVLAVTALHHDMSVYDIFGILAAGGAIVMPDRDATRSPDHWLELIAREHVTVWNSVPAFMEMLLVHAAAQGVRLPGHLRVAFLGGDWIPLTAPARIRRHFGDVQAVSVGGPTETTVWNIWYAIGETKADWASIPYGHPIANTHYYVLDENLDDCPPGTPGEMCCAGVGLLKGYWRNEEQTRARTAIHPRTGERIYRTGDRGRFMADGALEFLGRIDRQVKISGQRIELGEIEASLNRQPGVRQAIVDAVDLDGHKKLVAYVVREPGMAIEATRLRAALEKILPAYMIPFSFVALDALPLNTNGKVDRALLPAPTAVRVEPSNGQAQAAGSVEEVVSAVWRKLLGLECISVDDNFFDLGGDSILLVEAHGELQQLLGRTFPVTDLFQFPTVRSLGRALEEKAQKPAGMDGLAERARKQRAAIARKHMVSLSHE
jgi:acyl-coenzyme A synthetase/AMP-(fatty) acid ligase/acyl carrier protein